MINTLIGRNGRTRLTPMADLAQRAITDNATLDQTAFDQTLNRFNEAKILAMNKYDAASMWLAPGAYKAGSILPFLPKSGLTVPFTRNSAAWRRNGAGAFVQEAIDTALIHYRQGETCPVIPFEPSSINHIRNPIMNGAVVGTPGTLPTNWTDDNTLSSVGLSRQVVQTGVVGGLEFIDLRIFGTASQSNSAYVAFDWWGQIVAAQNQQWNLSFFCQLIASLGVSPTYRLVINERDTSPFAFITDSTLAFTPTSTLTRYNYSRQIASALTDRVQGGVLLQVVAGRSYNFTIRLAMPQMEPFNYQTSPMRSNGSAAFARAVSQLPLNALQAAGVFAANEGCVFLDLARMVANAAGTAPFAFRRADGTEVIRFEANGVANQYRVNLPTLSQASAYNAGTRIAVAWDGANVRISQGGVLLNTFTGTLGAIDQLRYTGNGLVDVRELLGYSAAPTDAALNALTV